jgi:type 1 glutamine amidotransferase
MGKGSMKGRVAIVVAPVLALGFSIFAGAQTGNPGGAINDRLGEMDYGVCRGMDPKCFHDWPRPKTTEYRVLLYTRTGVSRHGNLGPLLPPGLNPPLVEGNTVQRQMQKLAQQNGFTLDYTEDVTQLQAPRLSAYNAVIFFSTSRDILDDGAKTALRQYMRAGGGFVAVHNAFGTLYNWPYYEGLLGGANFYDHGSLREGDVVVRDSSDVSTKDLPKRWRFRDEWYNLVPFPTHVRFLATVDEKSWGSAVTEIPPPWVTVPPGNPGFANGGAASVVGKHPGHGSFHPVVWCQYYDGGKVWVTTLGHDAALFDPDNARLPGAREFQTLIVGGIKSVMGLEPFCR